jgi:hypothetical protein
MALFGDLGKALGLGSGEDLLPLIGTAAGFYFGGPLGASIGSGIGSLAGGKSVNDALTNAALAYGVSSFVSPSMMQNPQATGAFGQNALQKSLYGPVTGIQSAGVNPVTIENMGTISDADLYDVAMSDAGNAEKGFFDGIFDNISATDMGLAAMGIGALAGGDTPEDGVSRQRPYAGGEAWDVQYQGVKYDLDDPDQREQYTKAKAKTQDPAFRYAKGGSMDYNTPVRGEVAGPGTGTSDSVPARLSDGEFVLTAKAVRGAGSGDRDIGAARLYDMMAELEATA